MIRTQIQLPDNLYREVQRVARDQEWSIAEVIRRGAESVIRAYPSLKQKASTGWKLPAPIRSKMLVHDPEVLRDLVRDDADTIR
jgi:hypothetical protein